MRRDVAAPHGAGDYVAPFTGDVMTTEPLGFSTRDASWYNRPNVRSVKQHHAIVLSPGGSEWAACDSGLPLVGDNLPARLLAPTAVCGRPACQTRYREQQAEHNDGDSR